MPKVTVGIPFYNCGALVHEAVRSLFAQTLEDWEAVIVDDGSVDGGGRLLSQIRDPRISVIRDGRHLGLVARLNQITDLAQGQYIARMDADDLMWPERLATQTSFLDAHPAVSVVDSDLIVTDANRRVLGIMGMHCKHSNVHNALKYGRVVHACVMARREWYRANRYNPAYLRAEDRELFIRTYQTTTVAHLSTPLYFYLFEGNIKLKAFFQSYTSERRVIRRYGPALVGGRAAAYLYTRSLIKTLALVALMCSGTTRVVTRRAYRSGPESLIDHAQMVCKKVREHPVPGWP